MERTERTSFLESRVLTFILVGVILMALLGFAIWKNRDDACEKWQQEYADMVAEGGGTGALGLINLGPVAELEDRRPDGCATPN